MMNNNKLFDYYRCCVRREHFSMTYCLKLKVISNSGCGWYSGGWIYRNRSSKVHFVKRQYYVLEILGYLRLFICFVTA